MLDGHSGSPHLKHPLIGKKSALDTMLFLCLIPIRIGTVGL